MRRSVEITVDQAGNGTLRYRAQTVHRGQPFIGLGTTEQAAINDLKWAIDFYDRANEYPKIIEVSW